MSMNELQKQTNTNIQEKANLIWESATHLVGLFKPHEYGKVILPLTVLKRFDDALAPTKQAVLDMKKKLDATNANEQLIEGALTRTSNYAFYNTSKIDCEIDKETMVKTESKLLRAAILLVLLHGIVNILALELVF